MESLTWEEFHAATSKLTTLADPNGPWLLVQDTKGDNLTTTPPGSGYLKTERFAKACDLGRYNKMASKKTLPGETVIRCEYHVVYSLSYSVPVLYFNFILPDGSLMKLEDVWSIFRGYDGEGEESDSEWLWNAVSQQDHPVLHVPFFWIHPCHTKTFMKQLSSSGSNPALSYLITWLSIVATKVGLDMPLHWSHYVVQQHLQQPDDED